MPEPRIAPYGSWASPITSDLMSTGSNPGPQEQGRTVVVKPLPTGSADRRDARDAGKRARRGEPRSMSPCFRVTPMAGRPRIVFRRFCKSVERELVKAR